jgi:predicted TIM-barrel fold metal-dependent hydrolase
MIIDCHAHLVAFPVCKNPYYNAPWISADEYVKIMDQKGVDKAVILPLSYSEFSAYGQNFGEILYICQKYPDRFIPFCNIDPRLPKRPDLVKVDDFLFHLNNFKELGAKGIGELVARMPWNEPRILKMLEAAEIVNLPITFHTITPDFNGYGVLDYPGLELLESVLKKFPKLKFLGHSTAFWSEISGDLIISEKHVYSGLPIKEGGAIPRLMREYPNLYGDISAGSGLNALQRDTEHAWKFIDEFQDRLLLGLDYCSITNNMQHIEWLTKAKDDKNISIEAYDKIMWKNINRVLNLGLK